MGQVLAPSLEAEAALNPRGVDYFLQLSQAQIAAMVREGMSVDMVMNPYQMPRLETGDDTNQKAEVKPTLHLNNPLHLEQRSLEILREFTPHKSSSIPIYKLQMYLDTAVPFYIHIHMFVMEEPDSNGLPTYRPIHPSLQKPITISLNPALGSKFSQVLPQTFVEALAYVQARSVENTPDVSAAALPSATNILDRIRNIYPHSTLDALEQVYQASLSPHLHNMVIVLQPAMPLPFVAPSVGNSSLSSSSSSSSSSSAEGTRGFCFQETTVVTFTPTLVIPPSPSPSSPPIVPLSDGSLPALTSPLYMGTAAVTLQQSKQYVAGGEGLYELLEVYGYTNQPKPPSIVAHGADAQSNGNDRGSSDSIPATTRTSADVAIDMPSSTLFSSSAPASTLPHALCPAPAPDCVICMSLPSEAIVLPCRHICMCAACAQALTEQDQQTKCPMCRERVTDIVTM